MRTTPRVLMALAHVSVGGAAALAALAVVPGHAVAAPMAADDRYVRHLADSGWTVEDQAQIIRVAHAECQLLGHGTSTADVLDNVITKYRITPEAAITQLVAAEGVYCPEHLGH
jgi:Protein of unknown function (DUF732)